MHARATHTHKKNSDTHTHTHTHTHTRRLADRQVSQSGYARPPSLRGLSGFRRAGRCWTGKFSGTMGRRPARRCTGIQRCYAVAQQHCCDWLEEVSFRTCSSVGCPVVVLKRALVTQAPLHELLEERCGLWAVLPVACEYDRQCLLMFILTGFDLFLLTHVSQGFSKCRHCSDASVRIKISPGQVKEVQVSPRDGPPWAGRCPRVCTHASDTSESHIHTYLPLPTYLHTHLPTCSRARTHTQTSRTMLPHAYLHIYTPTCLHTYTDTPVRSKTTCFKTVGISDVISVRVPGCLSMDKQGELITSYSCMCDCGSTVLNSFRRHVGTPSAWATGAEGTVKRAYKELRSGRPSMLV